MPGFLFSDGEVDPFLELGIRITSYLAAYLRIEFMGHIFQQP